MYQSVKPVVISDLSGYRFKNGGPVCCVEKAFSMIVNGADVLDAVAALEGVRTPSLVAKAVLEQTDHHLLCGKGAQDFARNLGFRIETDLNTEKSRSGPPGD